MLGLKVYAPRCGATDLREITRPVGEWTVSSTLAAPDQNPPTIVMPVLLAGLWRTMLNRVSAGLPTLMVTRSIDSDWKSRSVLSSGIPGSVTAAGDPTYSPKVRSAKLLVPTVRVANTVSLQATHSPEAPNRGRQHQIASIDQQTTTSTTWRG